MNEFNQTKQIKSNWRIIKIMHIPANIFFLIINHTGIRYLVFVFQSPLFTTNLLEGGGEREV